MVAKDRIGKIYDGRWKVIEVISCHSEKYHDSIYKLQNIYNNKTIELNGQAIRRVEKGKTTISKIQWLRLKKQHIGKYKF